VSSSRVRGGGVVNRAVFINYRSEDSHSYGAMLYQELRRQFGEDRVFLDCESIPAGADFVAELLSRVRSAPVLLAVIGPRWLTATDNAGRRRIDNPNDWIRRELAEAFTAGVTVIPVLTGQIPIPAEADLPAEIAALSRCQYRRLRHKDSTADLARIVTDLTRLDPSLAPGESRRFFSHLIDYHNEKFAGRDAEIRTIVEHIDRHDRGYVYVDGLSGFGKTSLLAVLVRQQPHYLYHFISQRYKTADGAFDPTRLDDLLGNLCEQLDPRRAAPLSGRALTTRFIEVVTGERDQPTVLVLDAIDEVDRHPSFLLGLLPKRLPKNLFILLSARSQGNRSYLSEVGLTPDDIGLRVTLDGLGAEAVHDLLLHHAGPAGAALAKQDGFVDSLHAVSATWSAHSAERSSDTVGPVPVPR
jgi:hypothetical protein